MENSISAADGHNEISITTNIRFVSFQADGFLKDNNNAAQRLIDGMNFMAQSVSELGLGPTKAVTSWLTDQIAPAYWKPNSQILVSSSHYTFMLVRKHLPFSWHHIFPFPTSPYANNWKGSVLVMWILGTRQAGCR